MRGALSSHPLYVFTAWCFDPVTALPFDLYPVNIRLDAGVKVTIWARIIDGY
jgi:hypothetical protein